MCLLIFISRTPKPQPHRSDRGLRQRIRHFILNWANTSEATLERRASFLPPSYESLVAVVSDADVLESGGIPVELSAESGSENELMVGEGEEHEEKDEEEVEGE